MGSLTPYRPYHREIADSPHNQLIGATVSHSSGLQSTVVHTFPTKQFGIAHSGVCRDRQMCKVSHPLENPPSLSGCRGVAAYGQLALMQSPWVRRGHWVVRGRVR